MIHTFVCTGKHVFGKHPNCRGACECTADKWHPVRCIVDGIYVEWKYKEANDGS